jgi:PKD repeat protein
MLVRTAAVAVLATGLTAVTADVGYAGGVATGLGPQTDSAVTATVAGTEDTWHLDETSGTMMQDSTGSHPGLLHNITLGRTGVSSTAYGFNGTSSYVRIPSAPDLNAFGRDVRISFDLRTTTVPALPDYDLFRKGQAPGPEYKVEMQPSGQISCYFKGDLDSVNVEAGPDLHDGAWHHVVCEKHATSVTLTIDGVKYTKTRAVGSIANDYDVIIGAYPTGDFYQGELDELTFSIDGDAAPPTTSFAASATSGSAPLPVSFADTSSGSPTSWDWTFGDGGTSTARSPSHTFAAPGTYTVSLKARNASGSDTATRAVTVRDGVAPQGTYILSPGSAQTSTPVTLTQTSLQDDFTATAGIVRRLDWGDGSAATAWSSGTSTTHAYSAAGTYLPTVRLTDSAGNARVVSAGRVTVAAGADTSRPWVRFLAPAAHPGSVSSWRVLRGRSGDASGSGVRLVTLRLVERRAGRWYAYRPGTHTWVPAASRTAALRKAGSARVAPTASGAWALRVSRLRVGLLVGRLSAKDAAGNVSAVHVFGARLSRP